MGYVRALWLGYDSVGGVWDIICLVCATVAGL